MNKLCDIKQKRLNGATVCSKLYALKPDIITKLQDVETIENNREN